MTQHFLVYFKAGTDEVVAVYTNNDEQPITRTVLDSNDMALDGQEFTVETDEYLAPKQLFRDVQAQSGRVTFKRESPIKAVPIEQTARQVIPRRILTR